MLRKVTADELFGSEPQKVDQKAVARNTREDYLLSYYQHNF